MIRPQGYGSFRRSEPPIPRAEPHWVQASYLRFGYEWMPREVRLESLHPATSGPQRPGGLAKTDE